MINEKGEEVGIIYGWYCTITDKWYIGQTIRPEVRFKTHIHESTNQNDNNYFHRALRKYGLENFVYCVLEENVLRENLNMKEQEWIEYYDSFYSGYNLSAGGGQTIYSDEVKRKLSESHKGKSCWWSKGKPSWNKGKHCSEETKRKMSEAHKGRPGLKGPKSPNYGNPAPNRRKVSKYDLNGNYIQTYISIKEAKNQNPKAGHLKDVCKGLRKQAGGFIWKYA